MAWAELLMLTVQPCWGCDGSSYEYSLTNPRALSAAAAAAAANWADPAAVDAAAVDCQAAAAVAD